MNFIWFLIGALIIGFIFLKDKLTPVAPPLNDDDFKKMQNEMLGKSQNECKKIANKYYNNKK